MCKKLIYLVSFVLVLGLASNASADPNLVAYYRLDGDARDTGNVSPPANGRLYSDPTWTTGRVGGSIDLDGDDYVDRSNNVKFDITDEITLACWIKTTSGSAWQTITTKPGGSYQGVYRLNFDGSGYDAGTLDLGQTYYWRVDEAKTPTTWEGDVWNFATPEYFVVDDFELYNDLDPDDPDSNRIFITWVDGYDVPANGSQVGRDTFPFAEKTIVHGGGQSMPFYYNNTGGVVYSEAEADILDPSTLLRTGLEIDSDWTKAGVKALTLYFYGDPDNAAGAAEQMYVKLNGVKVVYNGDMADIKETRCPHLCRPCSCFRKKAQGYRC